MSLPANKPCSTNSLSLTHRSLCNRVAGWLMSQKTTQLVAIELQYNRCVLDVIGIGYRGRIDRRVTICEVKRTRADLLQDLKKKKLLKYEQHGTHCYLAATPEALRYDRLTSTEVMADLTARGLPSHWGVLCVGDTVQVLRGVRRHRPTPQSTLDALTKRIARKWMWFGLTTLGIVEPFTN